MSFIKRLGSFALVATRAMTAPAPFSLADEQNFPLQNYRVRPPAAGGARFFGGFIDSLNLINIRDRGVKPAWEGGETRYEVERGVEVHERL